MRKTQKKQSLGLQEKGSTRKWRKIRLRVLIRDNYKCQFCGKLANSVDHIKRRRFGGKDTMKNLRALCEKCNKSRY
jgi:5-methylcytosine-specific restriction protein A